MQVPALYARHLDALQAQATGLAEAWIDTLVAALRDPAAYGLAALDRKPMGLLIDLFQNGRVTQVRELAGHLREGMQGAGTRAFGHDSGPAALTGFDIDALTLVDEDQAEKDIEISRIVQLVDLRLEWEVRELQSLAATLLPDARWDEDATACGPSVFARAISQSLYGQTLEAPARTIGMRAAGPALVEVLRGFYERLIDDLKAQGVQPRGYRTILTPSGPSPAAGGHATPAAAALPAGVPGTGTVAAAAAVVTPPLDPQAQAALAQWIARLPLAAHAPAASTWRPSPNRGNALPEDPDRGLDEATLNELANFKLAPMDPTPAAPGGADLDAVHQLLGRLFARILVDPRLDPPVRQAIGQLQGSMASLAEQDPGLLSSDQHPAWALINQIAAHASELPAEQQGRSEAFMRFVEPLTARLAGSRGNREVYEKALSDVQGFIAQEQATQLAEAAPTRKALSEAEEKARLQPLLKQQVEVQLERASANSLVLETFLRGPWVEVLAQVMASQGADSPEAQALVSTVDDLLASLQRPNSEAERNALRASLPGLIDRVQRGMALIDLPQPHRERVLGDLMRTHRRLLAERPPETVAEAPAAPPIVAPPPAARERRDDAIPDTAAPAAAPSWATEHPSWLQDSHLGGLPTVPMGLHDDSPAQTPAQWLASLRTGQRCKLFLQGQWTTATLLWRSDNGEFYMFSSRLAGGVHSMTRRGLERLRSEGLATELAEQSLVQRAVNGVLQELGQASP